MGLIETFRAGGWPMYPILILGLCLIVASARQVRRPEPGHLRLVQELRFLTAIIGLLGTTLGMIHCLMGLGSLPPNQPYVNYALLGLGESLNCIALAFVAIGWSAVITTIGALRTESRE